MDLYGEGMSGPQASVRWPGTPQKAAF